jgi:hypothetical protein
MGIDFSVSKASWSYSGFHAFRRRLALEIGIDLDKMKGFGKGFGETEGKGFGETEDGLSWDNIIDPIALFLNHSDCDGYLTATQSRRVGKRLMKLVEKWPENDYDRQMSLELAKYLVRVRTKKVYFT